MKVKTDALSDTQDTPKKKEVAMNRFDKLVNFDNTDGAGSPPLDSDTTPQAGGKDVWTPEMQAEFDKRAAALKKSAAAEARQKAIDEFSAKQQTAKDESERQRLAEEGQYKDLAAKADSAKSAAEKRAEEAEEKAKALELQMSFDRTARSLKVEFANDQAAIDAFTFLDREMVGDDMSGITKAFEKLQKEHPHYFGEPQSTPNTDARERGRKQTNQQTDEQKQKEIIQRFNIRKPR
jgi:hypothetical protein